MKVAIMTDTNSGISVEEGAQTGVHVLPMPVLINGKTYYEGVTLTHEEFYRCQGEGQAVSTSQPAPATCWLCGTGCLRSMIRSSTSLCPAG